MPIAQRKPEEVQTLPGENPASNPRAVIGDNRPPIEETVAIEFTEELLRDRPDFMVRYDGAIAAVDRARVTDDETLGKAGDLDKILRACEAHISETHKLVKQPYLDGGRAVDAKKNGLIGPVTDARLKLRNEMNGFMAEREAKRRAEEARIAAEQRAAAERAAEAERERERAEAEAAAAAAAATSEEERRVALERAETAAAAAEEAMAAAAIAPAVPGKAEPIRSDAGATVSGRQVWNSEVTDYEVAFIAVSDNPKVREAIDKAVAQLVKAGKRQIEGVRVWPTTQAVAR